MSFLLFSFGRLVLVSARCLYIPKPSKPVHKASQYSPRNLPHMFQYPARNLPEKRFKNLSRVSFLKKVIVPATLLQKPDASNYFSIGSRLCHRIWHVGSLTIWDLWSRFFCCMELPEKITKELPRSFQGASQRASQQLSKEPPTTIPGALQ